jgi:hypothetical protein
MYLVLTKISLLFVYVYQSVYLKWLMLRPKLNMDLTFKGPCIASVFSSISYKMECYTISLFLQNALYFSSGSSAHCQELRNYTYSIWYLLSRYCYLSLSWMSSISSTTVKGSSNGLTNTRCCMYSFWAPGDGRRDRLKHVEHFAGIN